MTKNLLAGCNLEVVLQQTQEHVLGFTVVDVFNLKAGSQLRRAGPRGVQMWKEALQDNGFSESFFVRVYINKENCEDYDDIVGESRRIMKDELKQGRVIPASGLYIERDMFKDVMAFIIDGRHRITALVNICEELMKRHNCDNLDPRVEKFRYIRAIVYRQEIVRDMTLLSKASNDQVSVSVPEDALEKYSFIVAVNKEFTDTKLEDQNQARTTAIALTRHYLSRCGVKSTGEGKKKKFTGENYHSQVCGIALSIAGKTMDHIKGMLEDAENSTGRTSEVNTFLFCFTHCLQPGFLIPKLFPIFAPSS